MKLKMIFQIAFSAVRANKLRSVLTSLGMIIGVGAVIVMLAIGHGAQVTLNQQLTSVGSNLIIIFPGVSFNKGVKREKGSMPTLKGSDALALKKNIRQIVETAPILARSSHAIYRNMNCPTVVVGTTNGYFSTKSWELSGGRFFREGDFINSAKVVILGHKVVTELFADTDPIGKTVRIKGLPHKVIGTLKSIGGSNFGEENDEQVFIPLSTAQKKVIGTKVPDQIYYLIVQAESPDAALSIQKDIRKILRKRHNLGQFKEDDFDMRNLTQMMENMKKSAEIMTLLLGSIASISLLVGSIGIMNIMLVSVTERTKEIGIRMAIGAKVSDIRRQFLAEAFILTICGGLIGILLGIIGAEFVSLFSPFRAILTLEHILLPFGISCLLGLFFGYYPAHKASLLNPINALRYE